MLTFKQAVIPVITMVLLILFSVLFWEAPIQIALFFEIIIIIALALYWGYKWQEIEEMLFSSFKNIGNVILILFLLGMMIGLWIAVGTVPTMIYFGLQTISPRYFFILSFISTSLVSMAVGTAVGTASTIGLALISLAQTMGLNPALAAGAIISGSYVGDRMSPVSSIAIITAHSSEARLMDMIYHMLKTAILPYLITALIFLFIGLNSFSSMTAAVNLDSLIKLLNSNFQISYWLLLPPILIIILAILKIPTIINLALNILFSLAVGISLTQRGWSELLNIMFRGFKNKTGVVFIDNILSRGGLTSMLELISLIIFAVLLGGLLEQMGVLNSLLKPFIHLIKKKMHLITVTIFAGIISAALGCNQFLGVFLPAKMLGKNYDQMKVKRKELARALGDSGLIFSPLIPWNVNALMMTAVLGVTTVEYFPYAFFPLLMPFSNLLVSYVEENF
ncbi:Na+/H+ antiporter NhaC family protein [Halanaerobium sp. ST460_2HS_T2]|uniref:Na+/H+ antiporter NhaC family protein n=1 Tax=Halanaerobium sp. ST460_2HS_T2 TaxID=2183914 RepID=UPI000DF1D344|nr:Na+/H+ antiporter NhaC family protein [Halanaerobium sp. ST460_2HS_T2]RCW58679.1 transporter (NhaC family) [Halanaerobium sp. ST460_2HS_T2]